MPFCGKCGAKLEDIARFCPSCGSQVKEIEPRALNVRSNSSENGTSSLMEAMLQAEKKAKGARKSNEGVTASKMDRAILIGVLNLLILACAFMPWATLDLEIWSDAYSVPALFQMAMDSMGDSSFYEGFLSEELEAFILIAGAMWAFSLCALLFDIYRSFAKKSTNACLGSVAFLFTAGLSLVFFFSSSMDTGLGSMDGYVSPTGWMFAILGLSVASFAASIDPKKPKIK